MYRAFEGKIEFNYTVVIECDNDSSIEEIKEKIADKICPEFFTLPDPNVITEVKEITSNVRIFNENLHELHQPGA